MKGILHGSWLSNDKSVKKFVFWIETIPTFLINSEAKALNKKKKSSQQSLLNHPFHLAGQELLETFALVMTFLGLEPLPDKSSLIEHISIMLPSDQTLPLPSFEMLEFLKWNNNFNYKLEQDSYQLQAWSIEVIILPMNITLHFLQSLHDLAVEFEDFLIISPELYFWLDMLAFVTNILGAGSFLPMIDFVEGSKEKIVCFWAPVFHDEIFGATWRDLLQKAPKIITRYQTLPKTDMFTNLEDVLRDFCKQVLNFRLMSMVHTATGNTRITTKLKTNSTLSRKCLDMILMGLMTQEPLTLTSPAELAIMKEFRQTVLDGIVQFETSRPSPAKICFKLEPPENEINTQDAWKLFFYLQSVHDPSLLVPAHDVWREQRQTLQFLKEQFANPQELLLTGLGKAMKIFPPISEALQSSTPEKCVLNLSQTLAFLQDYSYALKAAGFGVLVPKTEDEGKTYIHKPNVQIKVTSSSTASGILNYNSVLNFQWQIAIGAEVLTEQELQMLLKYKEPLIYLKGTWVEINSLELQKTIDLLTQQLANGQSSLESALKLLTETTVPGSTLETTIIDQPEWLTKLFSETKEFELVDVPKTFTGILRPYQQRCVSWILIM